MYNLDILHECSPRVNTQANKTEEKPEVERGLQAKEAQLRSIVGNVLALMQRYLKAN